MSAQGAGARATGAGAQQKKQQQDADGKATAPPLQEHTDGGPPLGRPETLLPGSSEEEDAPAPVAPAPTTEEAARRKRRREQWEAEQEGARRWDLTRRLAAISTDVEFLAREVGSCCMGSMPCCTKREGQFGWLQGRWRCHGKSCVLWQ